MPMIKQENLKYRETIEIGKRSIDTNLYFLSKILKRIKAGYSPLILICGNQRKGKSFIGVWLCYTFMKMMDKDYNPIKNTFYDPVKAVDDLGDVNKEAWLIDEAGSIVHRREWYKKTNIALDKIIQTQAYKTMLYIFISPFASDIDKTFHKHFDFIFRVDDRGRFKVFQIFKKFDEFNQEKAIRRMFLDDVKLTLKDVPTDIWKTYQNYSIEQKEEIRKTVFKKEKEKEITDPFKKLRKELS